MSRNEKETPSVDNDDVADVARRETLRRLGLFAAYTAPALLTVMYSQKAAVAAVDSTSTC